MNIRDHQLNVDCYILRMLFINFMVTTNQKPRIDTQKIEEFKPNTKEIVSH